MIGILVGDVVFSAAGYLLYMGIMGGIIGSFIYGIYWLISHFYFVLAGLFNIIFGAFFTLDDVCDVFISVMELPIDGVFWAGSHLLSLLAFVSSMH